MRFTILLPTIGDLSLRLAFEMAVLAQALFLSNLVETHASRQ